MEGLIIFYIICCALGFFEMDYPDKSGLKYWQSRYNFEDVCLGIFEPVGWLLTLLAFIGFPGILLGLIVAICKEMKEKKERKVAYDAAYNKTKNSKVVDEIVTVIKSKGVTSVFIKKSGVAEDSWADAKYYYNFEQRGLPGLKSSAEEEGLADALVEKLGEGWTHSGHISSDFGEDAGIGVSYIKPRVLPTTPIRKW